MLFSQNTFHRTLRMFKPYNSRLVHKTLKSVHEGDIKSEGRKIALFAHWDPDGIVDEYVLHYLRVLYDLGFAVIMISTAENLDQNSIDSAKKYVYQIIHRENTGLDFASWKLAIMLFPEVLERDNLLLTNDSIYGPFYDLSTTFDFLFEQKSGLWGLNNSLEKNCNHIQSFFLWMTPEVMSHKVFNSFLNRISILEDKEEIIVNYEVGLSKKLSHAGIEIQPLFPFDRISSFCQSKGEDFQYQDWVERGAFNTTIFSWDVLLEEYEYPFIKTEVFKVNRFDSRKVPDWREVIPSSHQFMIPIIENHLRRVSPGSKAL